MRYIFISAGWFWFGIGAAALAAASFGMYRLEEPIPEGALGFLVVFYFFVYFFPGFVIAGIGHRIRRSA